MIKLAILTTVWKRPFVTSFHFRWMHQFQLECRKLGISARPFYVLEDKDPHLNLFKRRLDQFGHKHTTLPRTTLSAKSQAGLEALRDQHQLDWLMHLDSDEILSTQLLRVWKKQFKEQVEWFGSRSCYFFKIRSGEVWEFEGYHNHPIKNGGSCLSRQLLGRADWELWRPGLRKGLNNHEHRRLKGLGASPKVIDTQDYYGVVEIKGANTALHSMEWFEKKDLLRQLRGQDEGELFRHHPMLLNLC